MRAKQPVLTGVTCLLHCIRMIEFKHFFQVLLAMAIGMQAGIAAANSLDQPHEIWERYNFSFINNDPDSIAFAAIEAGARNAAAQLAPPRRLGLSLQFLNPPDTDPAHQINWMRRMFVDGSNGVVLSPGHESTLLEEIDFLAGRGIPVITLGNDTAGSLRTASIETNQQQAGRLLLEATARHLGPRGGPVAILAGDLSIRSRQERLDGVRKALANHPSLSLFGVYECPETINGSHDVLQKVVAEDRNRRIRAWIFLGGWPLLGVADLPWAPGTTVCVAMDALPKMLPYLEDNSVQALVAEDFYGWGEQAMQWLVHYVHDGTAPEPNLLRMPPALIDARNLADYRKRWASWMP